MATGQLSDVLRHLRRLSLAQEAGGASDGQLLDRFLGRGEEAAFEALLRRHGPMVLGVCRRVLQNADDAEDAFQATFLVLVRKAASVVPREAVGNWLYGVAYRTALKARELLGKRRAKERTMARREAVEMPTWDELRPLLDQELSRLPDKYRLPVVLCDLEGKKRKDVAQQLGWPEGTLSCRLARARTLLAKRLAKHGLTVTGATLGAALPARATAGVPEALAAGTVRAAMRTAAGQAAAAGLISAHVAALTEGVIQIMSLAKMKTSLFVVLAVGAMLTAGGVLAQRPAESGQAASPANRGSLRDTLLELDQQMWEARAKHDTDTLGRLLADDFLGLGHDGTRWTRSALLAHYKQIRTSDLQVTKPKEVVRLNADTAVLTYEARFKVYNRDGKLSDTGHQRMTSCWVQRDGGWFVKFIQTAAVPEPALYSNLNVIPYLDQGTVNNLLTIKPYQFSTVYNLPNTAFPTPRSVVTARQVVKGSAEVQCFRWQETPQSVMPFRFILAKAVRKDESSFPDLKEGLHLSGAPLGRVTELIVDGILKKMHHQFGRTTLDIEVPTAGAKKLQVDGYVLADPLKVLIDGKEATLKELTVGTTLTLRLAKRSDTRAAVEIRSGKAFESLQPKEAAARPSSVEYNLFTPNVYQSLQRSSAAQDLLSPHLYQSLGTYQGAVPWQNPKNGPMK
jgi:RNA polymerase sigma factor (sigma-70 family)